MPPHSVPVGVFGMFGSLTLVMNEDYSDGVKVLAQDLLGTAAEDIRVCDGGGKPDYD